MRKLLAIAAAAMIAGCSTAAQNACNKGEAWQDHSVQETCLIAYNQTQTQDREMVVGLMILGGVVAGASVYNAVRPQPVQPSTVVVVPR